MTTNLFSVPDRSGDGELFTPLADAAGFRVERIVSWGDVTPEGEWYDQDHDEWVVVLQGEGVVEESDGTRTVLAAGDALFLPAHRRHRVVLTSAAPPCIWLAVHGTERSAKK
jgi:cupin 2 domain-containing protein